MKINYKKMKKGLDSSIEKGNPEIVFGRTLSSSKDKRNSQSLFRVFERNTSVFAAVGIFVLKSLREALSKKSPF